MIFIFMFKKTTSNLSGFFLSNFDFILLYLLIYFRPCLSGGSGCKLGFSRYVFSSALAHLPRLTFGKASAALIAWLRNGSCAHRQKLDKKKKSGWVFSTAAERMSRERKGKVLDGVAFGTTSTLSCLLSVDDRILCSSNSQISRRLVTTFFALPS